MNFDMGIDEVKRIIKEKGYRRVIFHLPAGLMPYAHKLKNLVEDAIFLSTPNFGGCDVRYWFIKELNADALFLFAHTKPRKLTSLPNNVYFIDVQYTGKIPAFLPKEHHIVLVYTAPFRKATESYASFLKEKGKEVVIPKEVCSMCQYPGEITGCDVSPAIANESKADAFVVAADGLFHARFLATNTSKPVYNWLGIRAQPLKYPIARLFAAKKVGIFTSIKPGQRYDEAVAYLKRRLEEMGKDVLIVYDDVISYEINNFDVEIWVNAACPRLSDDEPLRNSIPLWYVLRHI